jgi:hypothetical protein
MTKGGEMYLSKNGLSNFIKLPVTAFEMKDENGNATGDVRHIALNLVKENLVYIYFSRIGDAPESILKSQLDLSQPISKWIASNTELVLSPELEWEGVNLPIMRSEAGPSREAGENSLRDPAIFLYDNKEYMLYSVKGESGIAIVRIINNKVHQKNLSKSSFEIRSGLKLINRNDAKRKKINMDCYEQNELDLFNDYLKFYRRISFMDQQKPIKKIFVMGCGRSGTWLLTALFSTMSDTHVVPIETTHLRFGLYTSHTKNLVMKRDNISYLSVDKIPECINIAYIVRHPFDVLTSFNPTTERKYHIDIKRWQGEMEALKYLVERKRPNTMIIRYEDLVINPSDVQAKIAINFDLDINEPMTNIVSSFSASPEALLAMHGLRKIDSSSLFKYKNSIFNILYLVRIKPRLGPSLEWVSSQYNYDINLSLTRLLLFKLFDLFKSKWLSIQNFLCILK